MTKTAIVIPARYGSTRLKAKALLDIGEKTLLEHVWDRATQVEGVEVYVATDHQDIAQTAEAFGARVLLTSVSAPSGTDRVAEASLQLPDDISRVINVQGDLPFISPHEIPKALVPLDQGFQVGTLVTCMPEDKQKNPNFVKAIVSTNNQNSVMRCHWFCRASMPYGHHHLGVYAYERSALSVYAKTAPHPLEKQESLEQLRFLTMGYDIGAVLVNSLAIEVNTQEDLHVARAHVNSLSIA